MDFIPPEDIKLITSILQDEYTYRKVQQYVSEKQPIDDEIEQIIGRFKGLSHFSSILDKWIRIQTQPFLSFKPVEDSSTNISIGVNRETESIHGLHKKKIKKRTTPTLSDALPETFTTGNISHISSSFTQSSGSIDVPNGWPSLTDAMNRPTPRVKPNKSCGNKTSTTQSSARRKIPESRHSKPSSQVTDPPDLTNHNTVPPQHTSSSSVPIPSLAHQISSSVKADMDSLGVAVEVIPLSTQTTDCITVNPTCDQQLEVVKRLAELHCLLIIHRVLPVTEALIFYSRLVTNRYIYTNLGKEIAVRVDSSTNFVSLLLTDLHLRTFITQSSTFLTPVLRSMGREFCLAYSDLLKPLSPDIAQEIQQPNDVHSYTVEAVSGMTLLGNESTEIPERDVETFIRPFHTEYDSRLEHKSQLEAAVYNERENCYDKFRNLFREFEDENRSDLDGSKIKKFWSRLQEKGTEILQMRDCNFVWFAEIFKEMLLFYGTNLPRHNGPSGSGSNRNTEYLLQERLGPGGRAQGSSAVRRQGVSSFHSESSPNDPSHHFPGNQQFFYRFIYSMDSHRLYSYLVSTLTSEILRLTDVSSTGHYHSLIAKLRSEGIFNSGLSSEMLTSRGRMRFEKKKSKPSTESLGKDNSHISFNVRILRLRVLGKFLGLLHFYPFWSQTLLNIQGDSPLLQMTSQSAAARSTISPSSILPVAQLLYTAWRDSSLTLAVPWVVSYLRMLSWDRTSVLSPAEVPDFTTVYDEHRDAVATLWAILQAPEFRLSTDQLLSRNRMYVLLEAQSFVTDFPSIGDAVKDRTTIIRTPEKCAGQADSKEDSATVLSIDEGNMALSHTLIMHVAPYLYSTVIYMQQRRAWVVNNTKLSKASSVGGSSLERVPKRQAPTLVSSRVSSSQTQVAPSASATYVPAPPSPRKQNIEYMQSPVATSKIMVGFSPPNTTSGFSNTSSHGGIIPSSPRQSVSVPPSMLSTSVSFTQTGLYGGTDIHTRLETAFWHSHPQLEQLTVTVLNHLSSALKKRMKDRVGDLVVKAWSCCEVVRAECGSLPLPEFQSVLEKDTSRLIASAVEDTKDYLDDFLTEQITSTLRKLYSIYSLSDGILTRAISLTLRRKRDISQEHLTFFSNYARKKIKEVYNSCIQQKSRAASTSQDSRSASTQSEICVQADVIDSIVGSESDIRLDLANAFSDLQLDMSPKFKVAMVNGAEDVSRNAADIFLSEHCVVDISLNGTLHDARVLCTHICDTMSRVVACVGRLALLSTKSESGQLFDNSSESVIVAINNSVKMITVLLRWCHEQRSCNTTSEEAGRIRIEAMKFFTLIGCSLFHFDMVVLNYFPDAFTSSYVCPEKQRPEVGSLLPSSVLIEALRLDVLNIQGVCRVIQSSMRPSIYNVCYDSHSCISSVRKSKIVLSFIGRMILFHTRHGDLDLDIDVEEGSWASDPGVKRILKSEVSAELVRVVEQVSLKNIT